MNGPCGNRTHLNIRFAGPAATPCSPKARIYPACAGEQPNEPSGDEIAETGFEPT